MEGSMPSAKGVTIGRSGLPSGLLGAAIGWSAAPASAGGSGLAAGTGLLRARLAGLARHLSQHLNRYLILALAVRRERRALAQLSPHLARDVGREPWQVRREAARAWWDLPRDRLG
jgi:uncharacterized protein YjiS (DUF1127 family)